MRDNHAAKEKVNLHSHRMFEANNGLTFFWLQNEKVLDSETDAARHAHFKDADKYCKIILGRVSRSHGCMTCLTFTVLALAVGAAVSLSPNLESLDFKKLSELFIVRH